jgi:hypothetical protein
MGQTLVTDEGVRITIPAGSSARTIAHELGHAAGLGDVPEMDNLMYHHGRVESWALNAAQVDCVLSWNAN